MAVDCTRALWLIVGLGPGVAVGEVGGRRGGPLVVGVELTGRPCCGGCGWHTAMAAVHRWGRALLEADPGRIEGCGRWAWTRC